MDKKYELVPELNIEFDGHTLHRIRTLREIVLTDGTVVARGELGGCIEVEDNLSHAGNAWVSDSARVFGDARVSDSAWVFGDAQVSDSARVFGDAQVSDSAWVFGDAQVSDGGGDADA